MGLTFFRRAEGRPRRLGILPGTFNPPTRAHLALGRAALTHVDEVVFILPRTLPHKDYSGVPFDGRMDLLLRATAGEPRFSVGSSEDGLFISIVRECREAYGEETECAVLCGRDAAERIVDWDYGREGAFVEMLEEFEMLVASRSGRYEPPERIRHRIHALELGMDCDFVSATEVRERSRRGENLLDLVPETIAEKVQELYS